VKPRASSGVHKILVPRHTSETTPPEDIQTFLRETSETDIVWKHIAEAESMEKYLLSYSRKSFRQASDSPCGQGIIHDAMSFSSLTPAGEELLQGNYPQSGTVTTISSGSSSRCSRHQQMLKRQKLSRQKAALTTLSTVSNTGLKKRLHHPLVDTLATISHSFRIRSSLNVKCS
jgi:hypothetical protein